MVKAIKENKTFFYVLISSILFFIIGALVNRQIHRSNDLLPLIVDATVYENNDLPRILVETFSLLDSDNFLIINKSEKKIYLYEDFKKVNSYLVTIGKTPGNKIKPGDGRTPEGIFVVKSIENSSNWDYDFPNDNLDPIRGAYGPWFIRLEVPGFNGIGIHGFIHDDALGERASYGCVRLNNEELQEIVNFARPGMPVIILPGAKDLDMNAANLKIRAYQ
jgi:hypothetical protein